LPFARLPQLLREKLTAWLPDAVPRHVLGWALRRFDRGKRPDARQLGSSNGAKEDRFSQ
jgi:hypothetical protein